MGASLRSLFVSAPIALEFLTPLRLRRVERWDDATFASALGWYPAVGLLIGLALLGVHLALEDLLVGGPVAALILATLVVLSAGLHLDGVADTADGMALQGGRSERLGVMSAGNVGPAGVMALVVVLLVQWSALEFLVDASWLTADLGRSLSGERGGGDPLPAALILAPALARWTVAPVAVLFRPARPRGLGATLRLGMWPFAAPLAALIAFGASFILFGAAGLALPVVAAAAAIILAAAASRMIGGVTGDTYGAAIEIAQAATLVAIIAASRQGWLEPTLIT